jgi:hypothetical protein
MLKNLDKQKQERKDVKYLKSECPHVSFMGTCTYNAGNPKIRAQIYFSIVNGNGTRATARMLIIQRYCNELVKTY